MVRKTREIGIRLSVKDKELVERALKGIGADGEAALKRIQRSAAPASTSLVALNRAASTAQGTISGFVRGMAAGLVPTLSLVAAIGGAKDAMREFGETADRSKSAGLDPEYFQGLAYGAQQVGIEIGELSTTLDAFYRNSELAEKGRGKLYTTLKAVNPELLKTIQLASSQEERLRLVADAIENAADKAGLAGAIFGEIGPRFAAVFEGGAEQIDRTIEKARELGIVVDRDLIKRADELGDEFDTATKVLDLQFKEVLIELAPLIITVAQNIAELIRQIRGLGNGGGEIIPTAELEADLAKWEKLLEPGRWLWDRDAVEDRVAMLRAQLQLRQQGDIVPSGGTGRGRRTKTPEKPSGLGGLPPDEDAEREAERQEKAIAGVIEKLREQMAALSMTNREQFIQNQLTAAHVTLADEDGRKIAEQAGAYYDQKEAIEAATEASQFFAQTTMSAIDGILDGSKSASEVIGDLARSLRNAALQAVLLGQGPLAGLLGTQSPNGGAGGLLGGLFSGLLNGGGGTAGSGWGGGAGYQPWAKGGVPGVDLSSHSNSIVRTRTAFYAAKGMGVMGERGAEAILPLVRDARGRLGVSGSGGGVVNVTIVNETGSPIAKEVTTQRNSDGSMDIRAVLRPLVGPLMAEEVARPGSPVERSLRTNFGLTRKLTGR